MTPMTPKELDLVVKFRDALRKEAFEEAARLIESMPMTSRYGIASEVRNLR